MRCLFASLLMAMFLVSSAYAQEGDIVVNSAVGSDLPMGAGGYNFIIIKGKEPTKGNIGIWTQNPRAALDVNGPIIVTGTATISQLVVGGTVNAVTVDSKNILKDGHAVLSVNDIPICTGSKETLHWDGTSFTCDQVERDAPLVTKEGAPLSKNTSKVGLQTPLSNASKVVNGVCGEGHYSCTSGYAINKKTDQNGFPADVGLGAVGETFTWVCMGSGGGSAENCTETAP